MGPGQSAPPLPVWHRLTALASPALLRTRVHGSGALALGGGAGFHAYGEVGWPRRARLFELDKAGTITTWKRLDPWLGGDGHGGMRVIDNEQLYPKAPHPLRSSDYVQSFWRPSPEQEEDDRRRV